MTFYNLTPPRRITIWKLFYCMIGWLLRMHKLQQVAIKLMPTGSPHGSGVSILLHPSRGHALSQSWAPVTHIPRRGHYVTLGNSFPLKIKTKANHPTKQTTQHRMERIMLWVQLSSESHTVLLGRDTYIWFLKKLKILMRWIFWY